jgi:hypothetical protein
MAGEGEAKMTSYVFTRNVKTEEDIYKEILVRDDGYGVVCHLAAKEDSQKAWLGGLLSLMERPDTAEGCQRLVTASKTVLNWKLDGDLSRFMRLAHALLAFLEERDESQVLTDKDEACRALHSFLEQHFVFRATYDDNGYVYEIQAHGKPLLPKKRYHMDLAIEGGIPECIPRELWAQALQSMKEQNASQLRQAIVDHEFLYQAARRQTDPSEAEPQALAAAPDGLFALRSFASFAKALVEFLEQSEDYADLRRRVLPDICSVIVMNEHESLDEQKRYLEHILLSPEQPSTQLQRLWDIVHDIAQDRLRGAALPQDRMSAIVGLISDHFLDRYDLDQAVAFWEKSAPADLLLTRIVGLYKHPRRPLAVGLAAFLVLAGLAWLNVSDYGQVQPWQSLMTCLALVILGTLYSVVVVIVGYLVYRITWKHDLYYTQLFLPRLLGAIIVGLSVILLQDIPWQIGAQKEPLNFALMCLIVYLLSFIFLYIVVYQAVKFLPASPDPVHLQPATLPSASRWPKRLAIFRRNAPSAATRIYRSAAERAMAVSWRIYTLGVLESFLTVMITTTLIYPATELELQRDLIGYVGFQSPWLSFSFFPALVFLWTGLALFVGAFVQLIWQERRITSPA